MRRSICLAVVALGCAASTAWSQDAGQGARPRRGGRMGPGDVEQAVVLTAEQKEKVQALLDKTRQDMRDQMGQPDPSAMQKVRDTRQQILDAAKAGDDKKVESLQKELNDSEFMAQRRKLMSGYYDEAEKVLTAEQKKPFQAWRKLLEAGVPASLVADPEALKAGVKKVNLSDVQQKKVDAAFKHAEAKEGDSAQAKKTKAVDLAAAVVEVLKPSQKVLLADSVGGAGPGGGAGRAPGEGATSAPAR